jgi:hypothetical protein
VVVRARDEPRPHDERLRLEHLSNRVLAERLQRPVALLRHLVVAQIAELRERAVLVVRPREVGVDGDARHEAVQAAVGECLG